MFFRVQSLPLWDYRGLLILNFLISKTTFCGIKAFFPWTTEFIFDVVFLITLTSVAPQGKLVFREICFLRYQNVFFSSNRCTPVELLGAVTWKLVYYYVLASVIFITVNFHYIRKVVFWIAIFITEKVFTLSWFKSWNMYFQFYAMPQLPTVICMLKMNYQDRELHLQVLIWVFNQHETYASVLSWIYFRETPTVCQKGGEIVILLFMIHEKSDKWQQKWQKMNVWRTYSRLKVSASLLCHVKYNV